MDTIVTETGRTSSISSSLSCLDCRLGTALEDRLSVNETDCLSNSNDLVLLISMGEDEESPVGDGELVDAIACFLQLYYACKDKLSIYSSITAS